MSVAPGPGAERIELVPADYPEPPNSFPVTLLNIVVVGAVGIVLILLLAPAVAAARWNAKRAACENNLKTLWKLQHSYRTRHGASTEFSRETGGAFWIRLTTTTPPLIEGDPDVLRCPFRTRPPGTICDYRGPAHNINTAIPTDPVGADVVGNHGINEGGALLRKSGDVQTCAERDPLWIAAERATSP